ncbi:MAG: hypothetical protein JWN70_2653, partial [Planctomycetaceae bacterium]|nr:hypothetical protein [Planctomycetaceae bacterium]
MNGRLDRDFARFAGPDTNQFFEIGD